MLTAPRTPAAEPAVSINVTGSVYEGASVVMKKKNPIARVRKIIPVITSLQFLFRMIQLLLIK